MIQDTTIHTLVIDKMEITFSDMQRQLDEKTTSGKDAEGIPESGPEIGESDHFNARKSSRIGVNTSTNTPADVHTHPCTSPLAKAIVSPCRTAHCCPSNEAGL